LSDAASSGPRYESRAVTQFTSVHVVYLLEAARWTILLSLIAIAGGAVLGLALALARVSKLRMLRALAIFYIQIVQGTPLLILLFLSYFGLSLVGLRLDPLVAAGVSLTFYVGAFLGEIWRGCIEAVPRTQWEASDCLGLNRFQQYIYVILPQAVRIATPPTVGFMVQVVKNTSLASIIGFVELTRAGQIVNNSTFQPFLVFLFVAAIYFAICYPLSVTSRALERKMNAAR
jgi:polar amino acid transport system permease protein